MENEPSDSIPPELQVWIDTEIVVPGLNSPLDHQKIESVFSALPGIGSLSFLENRIAIRYDPERVTKSRLCGLIGQAGYQVSESESASANPSMDSSGDGVPPIDDGG